VFEINQINGYSRSADDISSGAIDLSRMQRLGEVLIDPTGDKNDISLLLCAHVNFSMHGKIPGLDFRL
jgi:hypothetical protein